MPEAAPASPPEDVAAPDDDGDLAAGVDSLGDIPRKALRDRRVNSIALLAHQGLAREL